ncbi:MAG: hypothetical protein ACXVKO_03075 [Bacteriovorax sp.]
MQRRSSGGPQKKCAFFIQFVSAVLFIVMGLTLGLLKKNVFFAALFFSEGAGQFFLALENQSSLREGDIVVTYFKKNNLGFFAALSFSFTMVCRYYLAAHYTSNFSTILLAGGILSTLIYLRLYKISSLDKEGLSGLSAISIMASAICLGLLSFFNAKSLTDLQLGINQFAYATLLLTGVLFLRPWVAEMINIVLWGLLFFFIF